MRQHKFLPPLIVFLFLVSLLPLYSPPVNAATTMTGFTEFNGQSGCLREEDTGWAATISAATADTLNGVDVSIFENDLGGGSYRNDRGYLFYNTSSIPDSAIITAVNVSFPIPDDEYDTGNIIIENSNAGSSLDVADYNRNNFGARYSLYSWVGGGAAFNVSFNQNISTSINKLGISTFVIRFECDYLGVAPAIPSGFICGSPNLIKLWVTYGLSAPTGFTATHVNATKIRLAWTTATGCNTTVRYKMGSYPVNASDGTSAYNGSGSSVTLTGLIPSKHYYFRAWSYTTFLSTTNVSDDEWTPPEVPTNVNYLIKSGASFINITWVNGTGGNRTTVRRSSTAQPTTPWEGTNVSNNTKQYYNNTGLALPYYYTLFSYNTTTGLFSNATYLTWYVVWVNVYNESSNVSLTDWSIFITNTSGSQTYNDSHCNNPTLINVSDLPKGTGCIIQVSRTNYTSRIYTRNIVVTGSYYINAYLAHFEEPEIPPTNTSYFYTINVINEMQYTVSDVLVSIQAVVNGSFVNVSSSYTDGNGQIGVYLIPGHLYKVSLSKTGYDSSVNDYIPSASVFIHTLKIYVTDVIPDTSQLWGEEHTFDCSLQNSTGRLYVNYTDFLSGTTSWTVTIYWVNNTSTLMATYTGTNDTFSLRYPGVNTRDYHVFISVNHTTFGNVTDEDICYGYRGYFMHGKSVKFNTLMLANFGWCPFGWSNVVGLFIMLGVMFSFGRRDTYLSAFVLGAVLLLLDIYIGFPTVWNGLAAGFFPVLIIFIGVLMMIRDRGMYGAP